MAGFLAKTPAGFYDGRQAGGGRFTDASNLAATQSDLSAADGAAHRPDQVGDGTASRLNPAYTGTYPNPMNFGWYTYYPSATAAAAAGLPAVAHLLKANPGNASPLRGGEGSTYARFHVTGIAYADPNDSQQRPDRTHRIRHPALTRPSVSGRGATVGGTLSRQIWKPTRTRFTRLNPLNRQPARARHQQLAAQEPRLRIRERALRPACRRRRWSPPAGCAPAGRYRRKRSANSARSVAHGAVAQRRGVHERHGRYLDIQADGPVGPVLGPDIDLRLFFNSWKHFYAVSENGRHSLQFFDRGGEAVHKVYRTGAHRRRGLGRLRGALCHRGRPARGGGAAARRSRPRRRTTPARCAHTGWA